MAFGVMFRFPAPTPFSFWSQQAATLPMRRTRDALGCAAKMAALHAEGPQFIAADYGRRAVGDGGRDGARPSRRGDVRKHEGERYFTCKIL